MCTSSMSSSSPFEASPNSYFVSARISPLRAPAVAAPLEQRQRHCLDPCPQLGIDQASFGDVGTRQRYVVATVFRLGRRGDDRRVEARVLGEPVGELVAVDDARPGRVLRPQRRVGDARDVAPNDHLDRQRRGAASDQDVRVGHGHDMVVDEVAGLFEPPGGELVEDLPLVRHAGDDPVERRETVGGDEHPVPVGERVRHTDLAVPSIVEREFDVGEWCRRRRHQRSAA